MLKELLDQNYVEQRPGVSDRRQRLLYPTNEGRRLARDLARLQTERFTRALASLGPDARPAAIEFLLGMIDPQEREKVSQLVWRNGPQGGQRTEL